MPNSSYIPKDKTDYDSRTLDSLRRNSTNYYINQNSSAGNSNITTTAIPTFQQQQQSTQQTFDRPQLQSYQPMKSPQIMHYSFHSPHSRNQSQQLPSLLPPTPQNAQMFQQLPPAISDSSYLSYTNPIVSSSYRANSIVKDSNYLFNNSNLNTMNNYLPNYNTQIPQIPLPQSRQPSIILDNPLIRMKPSPPLSLNHAPNKYSYTQSYMTNSPTSSSSATPALSNPVTSASTSNSFSQLSIPSNSLSNNKTSKISVQRQDPLINQYSNKVTKSEKYITKPSVSMIDEGTHKNIKLDYSKVAKLTYEISQNMIPISKFKILKPSKESLIIQKSKRTKRKSKFTKEQDDLIVKLKNENKTWVEIAEIAKVDSYLAARNRYQVLIGQQGGSLNGCGPEDVLTLKKLVDEGEIEKMKYLAKEFMKFTGKTCNYKEVSELIRYLFWKDPTQFDIDSNYLAELKKLQNLRNIEFGDDLNNQLDCEDEENEDNGNNIVKANVPSITEETT